jgi:transcription initiation factor TFIIH subunit 4
MEVLLNFLIERLNFKQRLNLYSKPTSCLAVFKILDYKNQSLIMSLLFLPSRALKGEIDSKMRCCQLDIIIIRENTLKLNPIFRESLQKAFIFHSSHISKLSRNVTIEQLDSYSEKKWENVLNFLADSAVEENTTTDSPIMIKVLKSSGLLMINGDGILSITHSGFQFLLMDRVSQVWTFAIHFVEYFQKEYGSDEQDVLIEVLQLFFYLASCSIGTSYALSDLTKYQSLALTGLCDFGLVYMRKSSSSSYYPTRFSTFLLSKFSSQNIIQHSESSFLVVETNYRIYAYTSSSLQISILSLFTQLKYRFPNLVVGILTRESVGKAFGNGISANQIVHFLISNAHIEMKKDLSESISKVIPSTIIDQISLWEIERNRLDITDGYLYRDFGSLSQFDMILDYSQAKHAVLWFKRDTKNHNFLIMVREEYHDDVRGYVRALLANE